MWLQVYIVPEEEKGQLAQAGAEEGSSPEGGGGAPPIAAVSAGDVLSVLASEPEGYFGEFFRINSSEYWS